MPIRDNSNFSLDRLRRAAANAKQELSSSHGSPSISTPHERHPHLMDSVRELSQSPPRREQPLANVPTRSQPSSRSPSTDVSSPLPATSTPPTQAFAGVPSVPTSPSVLGSSLPSHNIGELTARAAAAEARNGTLLAEARELQARVASTERQLAAALAENQKRASESRPSHDGLAAELQAMSAEKRQMEERFLEAQAKASRTAGLEQAVRSLENQVEELLSEKTELSQQPEKPSSDVLKAQQALMREREQLEIDQKANRVGILHMERQLQQANRNSAQNSQALEAATRGSGIQRAIMAGMSQSLGHCLQQQVVVTCWHARCELGRLKQAAVSKRMLRHRTAMMRMSNTLAEACSDALRNVLHSWQVNVLPGRARVGLNLDGHDLLLASLMDEPLQQQAEQMELQVELAEAHADNRQLREQIERAREENAHLQLRFEALEDVVAEMEALKADSVAELEGVRVAREEVAAERDRAREDLGRVERELRKQHDTFLAGLIEARRRIRGAGVTQLRQVLARRAKGELGQCVVLWRDGCVTEASARSAQYLETEGAALEQKLALANSRCDELMAELAQCNQRHEADSSSMAALEENLSEAKANSSRCDELVAELAQCNLRHEADSSSIAALEAQLSDTQGRSAKQTQAIRLRANLTASELEQLESDSERVAELEATVVHLEAQLRKKDTEAVKHEEALRLRADLLSKEHSEAAKHEEALRLRADLTAGEMAEEDARVAELEKDLAKAEHELEMCQAKLLELRESSAHTEEHLQQQLRGKMAELLEADGRSQTQQQEMAERLAAAEMELSQSKEGHSVVQCNQEVAALEARIKELELSLQQKQHSEPHESELNELKERLQDAEQRCQDKETAVIQQATLAEEERRQHREAEEALKLSQSLVDQADATAKALKEEIASLQSELATIRSGEGPQAGNQERDLEVTRAKGRVKELEGILAERERDLEVAKGEVHDVRGRLQPEIDRLHAEVQTVRENADIEKSAAVSASSKLMTTLQAKNDTLRKELSAKGALDGEDVDKLQKQFDSMKEKFKELNSEHMELQKTSIEMATQRQALEAEIRSLKGDSSEFSSNS